MTECKLLIVDDDERQRQTIQDAIREHNAGHSGEQDINFASQQAGDLKQAIAHLESSDFDGAIVDLKLRSTTEEAEGNTIIKEIIKRRRFPVFVLSAFPDKLDEEFKIETDIFRIKERTKTKNEDLLLEMASLLKTGISKLFGKDGELSRDIFGSLQEVFWRHVAYNWSHWNASLEDPKDRMRILTRYITDILSRKLGLSNTGLLEAHVAEMYFVPPLCPHLYTGDILLRDSERYLILNPSCDLVPRDGGAIGADFILLSRLVPLQKNEKFKAYLESQSAKNRERIEPLIQNKNMRYHYLPPYTQLEGFLVDFEDLFRVDKKEIGLYNRIASVTEPFLKNILARLTIYYSRLGQPDFNPARLLSDLDSVAVTKKNTK
jgi:CheY-like chemotaxis protein